MENQLAVRLSNKARKIVTTGEETTIQIEKLQKKIGIKQVYKAHIPP